jgi:hypothetical protein
MPRLYLVPTSFNLVNLVRLWWNLVHLVEPRCYVVSHLVLPSVALQKMVHGCPVPRAAVNQSRGIVKVKL